MRVELTDDEKQATIDAISRFKDNDPELQKQYEIEFVIACVAKVKISDFTVFLRENKINYQKVERKESDLFVVINMRLDKEKIIEIESYLTYFANKHGSKYDGWGAFE